VNNAAKRPAPNRLRLRAGVIAAGRGDRLRKESFPKPLVPVAGRPLIHHVLESIAEAGASEVCIIINQDSMAVRERVSAAQWPFAIRWIVESTPSSMHSFLRVLESLAEDGTGDHVLISTVDTIAPRGAYLRFVAEASDLGDAAVALAVTTVADDEKPLLVRMEGSTIVAIGDAAAPSAYATAGYYFVSPVILREAEAARRDGLGALRAFFERLVARGYPIAAVGVPASIDVDRPADVAAAEDFLSAGSRPTGGL
jgi:NDP-sugar pyrophosphorylase family protein